MTTPILEEKEEKTCGAIGKIGGLSTFAKYGKEHMSMLGKKGAKKRWEKFLINKEKTNDKRTRGDKNSNTTT